MRISITTDAGDFFTLDVDFSMELENLKALLEADTNIPIHAQMILHNGNALNNDKQSLTAFGVKQDDILLVRRKPSSTPAASTSAATSRAGGGVGNAAAASSNAMDARIEQMRQQLITNPQALAQISTAQPEVAQAALNDPQKFKQIMLPLLNGRMQQEMQRMQELAALDNADPFDVESQKKIEDMIRQQRINENMEAAMEHNPEAFGSVIMLYIDCEVNGKPVKAFVDSGAQTTIMSPDCAEYCGLMHLLDKRFEGMAVGVGTAKILGRIHATTLKVWATADVSKALFLQCSITVMEGKGVDMLLGLDMLKRFQASIDLSKNVLRIDNIETQFLSEKDLPEKAKQKQKLPTPTTEKPPEQQPKQQQSASASSGSASATSAAVPHPDEYISSLMALGASKEQAIAALDAANGNLDVAAGIIFSE